MILAFDPGYTTGVVALGNWRPKPAPEFIDFDVIASFEIAWQDMEIATHAIITANAETLDALVYERFKLFHHEDAITAQIGSEMPSSQVIGVIKLSARLNSVHNRLVVQETWARKQARVKPQHMVDVHGSRHTFDAYCHAHYYARTNWRALLRNGGSK